MSRSLQLLVAIVCLLCLVQCIVDLASAHKTEPSGDIVEPAAGISGGGTSTAPICWIEGAQSICIDSATSGQLTTYGTGGTNNEDWTCDYDATANTIACTSSTGVTLVSYAASFTATGTVTAGSADVVGALDVQGGDVTLQNDETISNSVDGEVTINATTVHALGVVKSTRTNAPGNLNLTRSDTTPTDNDRVGVIEGRGPDSGLVVTQYGFLALAAEDVTNGTEDGSFGIFLTENGSGAVNYLLADASAGTVALNRPLVLPTYTYHIDVMAGAAVTGPTAPSVIVQDTLVGLEFDADAEQAGATVEVPDCWIGTTDLSWKIYFATEAGDVIADTETVKWDCSYRSIDWETEATDAGTAESVTGTYTQSGAGTDSSTHEVALTIDYDSANQPITAGDNIIILCDRDVTGDTYSGGAILAKWELTLDCNGVSNH